MVSHVSVGKGGASESNKATPATRVAEWKWEHITMDFMTHLHGHRRGMMRYG